MTRRFGPLFALVIAGGLLGGCRDSVTPPAATPGPATPLGTATTAPPAGGAVVAAVTKAGGVELYVVPAGERAARRLRSLTAPADGARATSVTLSGGPAPTTCVVWRAGAARTLSCYAPGASEGRPLAVKGAPVLAALSYDGGGIAWVGGRGSDPDLYHGTLSGDDVSDVTRLPAQPDGASPRPPEAGGASVGALAWSGTDRLVVSVGRESDDGSGLVVTDLARPATAGWTTGARVRPQAADLKQGLSVYDTVVSASRDTALLAVQRSNDGADTTTSRAVVVDVTTGQARRVVAVPLPDRVVVAVSGGEQGVLYQTEGRDGTRTYWQHPGEQHGQPVTGLPAAATALVAQP